MDPVAFKLGPLTIYWYGIIIGIGILSGLTVGKILGKKRGIPTDVIDEFVLIVVPLAILGARLYYVLFNLNYFDSFAEMIAIWEGGLAIHGAILVSIITALVFTRQKKISFWDFADMGSPALILGQAIGRWGNYVNGEAYGVETNLPWAMYIAGAYRHPTFLYESLWNLIIFGLLIYVYYKVKVNKGSVFALYLIGYSIGRFIIEGFRTDSLMFGPFRVAQLISIAFIIIGFLLYYLLNRKKGA
ncbi:phosphatidylglycerol:prolipoprotein diacylglycerol transferase [Anaerobranca californiensis DSM 14826]|jgi:phosphatidylglycerol:prolipoprotein diacylglycerol transferase|uniref:Phosphatidylglycerol--prolipoprotein diacylglyceryl transferase n=1 Tax=Anaerobranca californiensis DSM 14826 TaxID=1120989 RepID=A0A1M6KWI9_9FIRM|nr:prolipoprotein diacylglyceryl transferase [Anaerobranca californiensis]SHJ63274.1 phosphatidylglycerol:prolipoprotein diacylglycerol transferase [Anaerobranca californiensis DSM 14826]